MKEMKHWKKHTAQFLIAQTISLFGSSLVQYGIIWYITLTTSSGTMLTLSTICGYVPQILISLFAGVWLDRHDRKRLIMLSDGIIALSTLVIALLFLSGHRNIWLLLVVLIIRSAGTGVQTPAVNAFLPLIVPKEHLMRVNGINSTLSSLMIFLSPAASGVLLSMTSIEITFFIDVVTAAIGISIMAVLKAPKYEKSSSQSSPWADIREGFHYLKANPFILKQIIYIMVVAVLISPSAFLTPLLVSRSFGSQVWRLTVSQMVFSLGAVAGGLIIAAWQGFKNRRHTILLSTAFYGTMMIGMGASPAFLLFLLFNGLIGISMPCYNTPVTVLFQEKVEPSMQGRVFSLLQIANACALPLGTIIFGPLADFFPVQKLLIYTGAAVVLYAAISFYRERQD